MSKSLPHPLKHAVSAVRSSGHGLLLPVRNETAFMPEALGLVVLPVLAWPPGVSVPHILLLVAGWLFVMVTELLNSALESLCDLVSPEYHILIKRAKDAGSAAVFLALLANLCFWLYLLWIYWPA